jgi:L,D-peptidoglycan transpeptidase YkuD (ErfK/YbiS/YcfS/YnhG family)
MAKSHPTLMFPVHRYVAAAVFLLALAAHACPAAEQLMAADADGRRVTVPNLARSRQILLVTAPDWNAATGEMRCFERSHGGAPWTEAWPVAQVTLGRTGLAWGRGLHGTSSLAGPVKREGDGKAPAGVFTIVEAFGFVGAQGAEIGRFPYRQLTEDTEGIDDPGSKHYNRLVNARSVPARDWKSSEPMRRIEQYRWGAVVGHNQDQVPGAGSCIFLHVWEAAGVPTSGCTAMPEPLMLRVLRWLDKSKQPILVQLPADEYRGRRAQWSLP